MYLGLCKSFAKNGDKISLHNFKDFHRDVILTSPLFFCECVYDVHDFFS